MLPGKPKSIEVSFDIGFTMLEDRITSADEFIFAARENISENGRFPEKLNAHVSTELLPGSLLTRREMEVAVLLLEGKSNNEIAHSLFIGLSTVKKHIAGIFEKTDVKSRASFIAKFTTKEKIGKTNDILS